MVITYAFFASLIFAAILAAVAAVVQVPFLATFASLMLFILVLVASILVVVGVAMLKIGSDGCVLNLKPCFLQLQLQACILEVVGVAILKIGICECALIPKPYSL